MTLRVDGKDYAYETHYDGTLYLWGVTGPAGSDVVATQRQTRFTAAVISSGETRWIRRGDHRGCRHVQRTARETITFSAPEAGSAGVQYVTGASGQPMADCYVAEAAACRRKGRGHAEGPDPRSGGSYRVYAARTAGVILTADNDDGFQFSDVYTVRVLTTYTPEKCTDAVYTGKAYVLPVELPQGRDGYLYGRPR